MPSLAGVGLAHNFFGSAFGVRRVSLGERVRSFSVVVADTLP